MGDKSFQLPVCNVSDSVGCKKLGVTARMLFGILISLN